MGGLDGREIEEDELHIASLEADADGGFGSEDVSDLVFEGEFRDPRTGEHLDPELVAKARSEVELKAKIGLDQGVDIAECLEMTGWPPISTRWVDVQKDSNGVPGCSMLARGTGFSSLSQRERRTGQTSSSQCFRWRRRSSHSERWSEGERGCGTGEAHLHGQGSRVGIRVAAGRGASRGSVGGSAVGCSACGQLRARGRNAIRRNSGTSVSRRG